MPDAATDALGHLPPVEAMATIELSNGTSPFGRLPASTPALLGALRLYSSALLTFAGVGPVE